jgi:hypothetical protein
LLRSRFGYDDDLGNGWNRIMRVTNDQGGTWDLDGWGERP